jgi:hypothetical protein
MGPFDRLRASSSARKKRGPQDDKSGVERPGHVAEDDNPMVQWKQARFACWTAEAAVPT